MSEMKSSEKKPLTVLQRVLDDQNFMLMLGLVVPTVLYTLWGVMEVVTLPMAQ